MPPCLKVLQCFIRLKTEWKSACFRIRANFELLSVPLQPSVRFFHLPLPAPPTTPLTVCLPIGR
ncbi:hypothetical protein FVH40_05875 [Salmonella enterica]|nr:hypothetical protein [Salmonella enterica]EBT9372533.1 hypothetical protein [Salmonella enterica]EDI2869410.1 hypothetical protein [Salmonella enterica subsp. enterica serovar Schwarzengrund]EEN7626131.1 hypothetical protein [Salmonella enterica]